MTEPPSQMVEELVKLYPNYSFRYTSAQAKTKHAVRNKIGTSEIASDYASAPCGDPLCGSAHRAGWGPATRRSTNATTRSLSASDVCSC
jgi:hypothetical protein